MRSIIIAVLAMFFGCLAFGQQIEPGPLTVGNIHLNPNKWGKRIFTIPIENRTDDTARVDVELHIMYPNHYLSGKERTETDTSYVIAPMSSNDVKMFFRLPGSFGLARMRLLIKWHFDGEPAQVPYDSVFQSFNNNFVARGKASGLDTYRYAIGPSCAMMTDEQLCYEYPRILLFLSARGKSIEAIDKMFRAGTDYTYSLVEHFRQRHIFPENKEINEPRILALDEQEGFAVHPIIQKFSKDFRKWYESKGSKKLDTYFREAGIDSAVYNVPVVRMLVLYSLLMNDWANHGDFDIGHFQQKEYDREVFNHLRWIIQGGEFFQPRLCLSAFELKGDNRLYFGLFRPDPSLACSKLAPQFMEEYAQKALNVEAIPLAELSAAQVLSVLKMAQSKKIMKRNIKELVNTMKLAQSKLAFYDDSKEAYLADYITRVVIGECFKDTGEFYTKRPLAVRYEK